MKNMVIEITETQMSRFKKKCNERISELEVRTEEISENTAE